MRFMILALTISFAHAHPAKLPVRCPDGQVVVGFDADGGLVCETLRDVRAAARSLRPAPREPRQPIVIDAELRRVLLDAPDELARSARVVPSIRDGAPEGLKVFGVRPRSIARKLGVRNGDVLLAAAGVKLTNPEQALVAHAKLKKMGEGDTFSVEISRRGQPRTLTYVFRAKGADLAPKRDGRGRIVLSQKAWNAAMDNVAQTGRGFRIIPHYQAGKSDGFKVVGIRPGSILRSAGLQSGDIVHSVSGNPMGSPAQALEAYQKFKAIKVGDELVIELTRDGHSQTQVYVMAE